MQASFFTPMSRNRYRVGKCYDIVQMDCEHLYETGYFNQKNISALVRSLYQKI